MKVLLILGLLALLSETCFALGQKSLASRAAFHRDAQANHIKHGAHR